MNIRSATIRDCADLAILDDMAGFGLPMWLWQGAVERGEANHPLDWGRERYVLGDAGPSWENAWIAESGGETAGMAVGYVMPGEVSENILADKVLAPIATLFLKASGHWIIDALAVYRRFQCKGIARRLIENQISQAGDGPVHLVAADDNTHAINLYHRAGFEEVARTECFPFSDKMNTKNWLLMCRPADEAKRA